MTKIFSYQTGPLECPAIAIVFESSQKYIQKVLSSKFKVAQEKSRLL